MRQHTAQLRSLRRGVRHQSNGYKGFGSFFSDNVQDMLATHPTVPVEDLDLPFPVPPAVRFDTSHGGSLRKDFLVDPDWTFVNHGAFGGSLRHPFDVANGWRAYTESQPLRFFDRVLFPRFVQSVKHLAEFLNCDAHDLVLVPNATTGINTVIQSMEKSGKLANANDQVLMLDLEYGATKTIVNTVTARNGAKVHSIEVKLPIASSSDLEAQVEDALAQAARAGTRTRLAVFDHITSNTGVVLPIKRLVEMCHNHGVPVLVDGAHGPVATGLDLECLGADYYVGNCHKWMSNPRGVGFLYAAKRTVDGEDRSLMPLVISHGFSHGFLSNFIWDGCRDYSAALALPHTLQYWHDLEQATGKSAHDAMYDMARQAHRHLAGQWGVSENSLVAQQMQGPMALVRLPDTFQPTANSTTANVLQSELFHEYNVECPVKYLDSQLFVRVSAQVYNSLADYRAVGEAVQDMSDRWNPRTQTFTAR